MIVTVQLNDLVEELRLLNKIAPAKHALPILSHILMTADDKLTFFATDLELGLRTSCPAEVLQSGVLALPAAKLLALVECFADPVVTLTRDDKVVKITCGGHTSRLQALSAVDFPKLAEVEGDSYTISSAGLRNLIKHTRYAVDEANLKFIMKGALLSLNPTTAAMIATDSKRIAVATMTYDGASAEILLPVKTLDLLASQTDNSDTEITVGPRHLFFSSNGRLLISRALESKFPNYQRMIPQACPIVMTVGRDHLAAALRRVALSAGESNQIYLDVGPGQLDLSARSAEVGDSQERVAVAYDGAPLKVSINAQLLLDTLECASNPSVVMQLKDEISPMLVCDGEQHLAVIMTMRAGAVQ